MRPLKVGDRVYITRFYVYDEDEDDDEDELYNYPVEGTPGEVIRTNIFEWSSLVRIRVLCPVKLNSGSIIHPTPLRLYEEFDLYPEDLWRPPDGQSPE